MAGPYSFDQIFAADPSNPERVASNGMVTIFAPGDTTKTPLTISTLEGFPLQNPVQVNDAGFGPAFIHDTLDQVAWEGGGFSGLFASYAGMKDEAVAARQDAETAAVEAEQSRVAAEAALEAIQAPADKAFDAALDRANLPGLIAEVMGGKLDKDEASTMFAPKPDNGGTPVGKGELVVSALDFGAKGDGVNVDAALIQLAVGATPEGGTLIFPAGKVFNLGWLAIDINKRIKIQGGTFLTQTGRAIRITADGAEVTGATITGPGVTVPYANKNPGIEVLGTSSAYISARVTHCTIKGMRDTAIKADYVRDFEISHNTIEYFRYGGIMVNSGKGGKVVGNTIKHAVQDTVGLSYGIAVSDTENTVGARSTDVLVAFNHIEDIPEWEGLDTHGGLNITFAFNTVKECRNGIVATVGNNDRVTAPERCRIIGNYVSAPLLSAQKTTTGVALGGSAAGNPSHPLRTDAIVTGNTLYGTTVPVSLPDSTGPTVDRSKSIIANNVGDGKVVADTQDTGWVPLTNYGTLQPGYQSNSTYPARIRVIKTPTETRVLLEGVISVTADPAPTTNTFFIFNNASLIPAFDRMVGTGQTVSGTIARFQLSVNANGAYRTIFPNTPQTANFTIAGEYTL